MKMFRVNICLSPYMCVCIILKNGKLNKCFKAKNKLVMLVRSSILIMYQGSDDDGVLKDIHISERSVCADELGEILSLK